MSLKNLQSLRGRGTLQTHGTSHWWISQEGGNNTSAKQPLFPSETSCMLTDINVTKPMRRISTRCIIYIFGNQYYLLNKWATTFTGWRDFSNVPCQHTMTTWRSLCSATNDAKNVHKSLQSLKWQKNRLWQLKAIKWNMISPCLRKIHCVIWNALFFTNVIDHWL